MSIETNDLAASSTDRRAYGRRKLDLESLTYRSRAAEFNGLPKGVTTHHALLDMLKAAAPALGLSRDLVELVDKLFSYTSPQDWTESSRPIVWPSNFSLAEDLDRGTRAIQAQIAALVCAGLIVMKDSPTGRRYGERDKTTKKLNLAHCFGFDLSMLAIRYEELKQAAEKHASMKVAKGVARRRAFIAKTKLLQMIETVDEEKLWSTYWEQLESRLATIAGSLKQRLSLIEGLHVAEMLERMAEDAQALLTKALDERASAEEDSSADESDFTLKTSTIDPVDSNCCNSSARASSRGPASPQRPAALEDDTEARDFRTTPQELALLAPPLGDAAGPNPSWAVLLAAADHLRERIGIPQRAWNQAFERLGRIGRLVTLADLLSFPDTHFTGSRPAYFQGMVNRAKAGQLRLDRALYGMRNRAQYRAADPQRHAVTVEPHRGHALGDRPDNMKQLGDIARNMSRRLAKNGGDSH